MLLIPTGTLIRLLIAAIVLVITAFKLKLLTTDGIAKNLIIRLQKFYTNSIFTPLDDYYSKNSLFAADAVAWRLIKMHLAAYAYVEPDDDKPRPDNAPKDVFEKPITTTDITEEEEPFAPNAPNNVGEVEIISPKDMYKKDDDSTPEKNNMVEDAAPLDMYNMQKDSNEENWESNYVPLDMYKYEKDAKEQMEQKIEIVGESNKNEIPLEQPTSIVEIEQQNNTSTEKQEEDQANTKLEEDQSGTIEPRVEEYTPLDMWTVEKESELLNNAEQIPLEQKLELETSTALNDTMAEKIDTVQPKEITSVNETKATDEHIPLDMWEVEKINTEEKISTVTSDNEIEQAENNEETKHENSESKTTNEYVPLDMWAIEQKLGDRQVYEKPQSPKVLEPHQSILMTSNIAEYVPIDMYIYERV